MEIVSLGDSAVVIRLSSDFQAAPEQALRAVVATQQALEATAIPGLLECAPAYDSIGLFFDLDQVARAAPIADDLTEFIRQRVRCALACHQASDNTPTQHDIHEIPVCYDSAFALDMAAVAQHTGISAPDIVAKHTGAEYRVHSIGFMPGFPYLGGLPPELATPRRANPRTSVPAGSVAIGGTQTGIYPAQSPGGWNVIGRTPLRLFDPGADPPVVLQVGDRVRFVPVGRAEFGRICG